MRKSNTVQAVEHSKYSYLLTPFEYNCNKLLFIIYFLKTILKYYFLFYWGIIFYFETQQSKYYEKVDTKEFVFSHDAQINVEERKGGKRAVLLGSFLQELMLFNN